MKTKSRWGRFAVSMQSLAKRPNRRRVEKLQTDNVCLTTVYRNGMQGAKSEGAQITYTQKVQDTEQVTKKMRKD